MSRYDDRNNHDNNVDDKNDDGYVEVVFLQVSE